MAPILFVTGTDTGVGKTFVTASLLKAFRRKGVNARGLKVIETGCKRQADGSLFAEDGVAIAAASESESVAPFFLFEQPLAPAVAASEEGQEIDIKVLVEKTCRLRDTCELLVVEGAGGILVPITNDFTFADYAKRCNAHALVVVGSRLGALNHALLTFEAIRHREIPAVGYILNEFMDPKEMPAGQFAALQTNRRALGSMAKPYQIEELAYVSHGAAELDKAADKLITALVR